MLGILRTTDMAFLAVLHLREVKKPCVVCGAAHLSTEVHVHRFALNIVKTAY